MTLNVPHVCFIVATVRFQIMIRLMYSAKSLHAVVFQSKQYLRYYWLGNWLGLKIENKSMRSCDVISLLTQFAFCNHGFYRMIILTELIKFAGLMFLSKTSVLKLSWVTINIHISLQIWVTIIHWSFYPIISHLSL